MGNAFLVAIEEHICGKVQRWCQVRVFVLGSCFGPPVPQHSSVLSFTGVKSQYGDCHRLA